MSSPSTNNHVRIGVIGIGGMGGAHVESLLAKKIARCELTAVGDVDPQFLAKYGQLKGFTDPKQLVRSGLVDAVLIATPHYLHTSIGIDALGQGLHVLTEKPLSVHKADCERL